MKNPCIIQNVVLPFQCGFNKWTKSSDQVFLLLECELTHTAPRSSRALTFSSTLLAPRGTMVSVPGLYQRTQENQGSFKSEILSRMSCKMQGWYRKCVMQPRTTITVGRAEWRTRASPSHPTRTFPLCFEPLRVKRSKSANFLHLRAGAHLHVRWHFNVTYWQIQNGFRIYISR